MSKTKYSVSSVEGLQDWVKETLLQKLGERHVLLLEGPLGAGKTELVKAIAKARGCEEASSPTFAIHHRYDSDKGVIEHLDLYRVENEDDLETVGLWELFEGQQKLIIIEWASKFNLFHSKTIPRNWPMMEIEILILDLNLREILLRT